MKRTIFAFSLTILTGMAMWSCQTPPDAIFPDGDEVYGLATPVQLEGDTTPVYLTDYFVGGSETLIDSVTGHEGFAFRLSRDKQQLEVIPESNFLPWLSEMKVWIDNAPYSFILQRSRKERFTFEFDPQGENYRSVALRGEMTDWRPKSLDMIDGVWQTDLELNPGRYEYLIVADGSDMVDPTNPKKVDSDVGGQNSLLEVGQISREGTPKIYPENHRRYTVHLDMENDPQEVFAFWENFRLPEGLVTFVDGQIHIRLPGDAMEEQRSYLRVWSYNEEGASNDLLIPLEYGTPVESPDQLTREDKETTILYFMMVDRFNNANPERDDPVDDPEVADRANFHGGDLDGIKEQVMEGYFEELGVNTVWMSPITQNPMEAYLEFPEPRRKYTGYHGYWPVTLTTVDHRFGSEEVLHQLVDEAHQRDISVMLDFVSNHVHENNPIIQENPDWATTLNLPDGRKNIRLWDEHRLTTWFDTFLPSLDFTNPEVVELMSDSAFFWIDNYNMDGFRHDATKHVHLDFWRTLTKQLKEDYMIPNDKRLFQIGETFGSRELIGEYVGSGLLDGQFDFNLYFDARSVFARDDESFEMLDYSLHQSFDHYGFQNLMGNITGNHDLPRFISLAGGDLGFDEDDTEPGWQREIGVGDPSGYNKLSQITAFIMTIPGIPVLYYGDEIGLPGASDPDSRRPMKFENLTERQRQTRDKAAKLANLRGDHLAFVYGDFETLEVSQDIYVYSRSYFGEHALVLFNQSSESKTVDVGLPDKIVNTSWEAHFGHDFVLNDDVMEMEMEPYSFEVLTGN